MQPLDDPFAVVARGNRGPAREDARHHRRLPRRGHVGESRDGLASRRPRHRRLRHAHARADGRRADPAEGHGLPHRRRDDRAARLDHRRHDRGGARPFPERAAGEVRAGHGRRPAQRGPHHGRSATGRATAIERLNLSAAEVDALRRAATPTRSTDAHGAICSTCRSRKTTRSARPPEPRAAGAARLHGHRADRRIRALLETASAMSGSKARCRTAACGTPGTCISR